MKIKDEARGRTDPAHSYTGGFMRLPPDDAFALSHGYFQ
jgi:hypothetical protein